MKNLTARAWLSLVVLTVVMGLLLFVPAGIVHYGRAWVYLSIFVGASALTTLYLVRRDRALLERRLHGGPTGETRRPQRLIMLGVRCSSGDSWTKSASWPRSCRATWSTCDGSGIAWCRSSGSRRPHRASAVCYGRRRT